MSELNKTIGGKIEDLITRFFYKEDRLCFRVMIKLEGGLLMPYNEYSNYDEYKIAYAELMAKKQEDSFQKQEEDLQLYMKIA